MRKIIFVVVITLISLFVIFSLVLFNQERLIFYPEKLEEDHPFNFENYFEEHYIEVEDNIRLHGLLFKADSNEGVVFYLHGNAGSVDSWGSVSDLYLNNDYNVFIPDYRGYGKSQSRIRSEKSLYNDIQVTYDYIKKDYSEDQIIIVGYSLGTGLASYLAAHNNPKMLILKAPYFNFIDLIHQYYPFIPSALIKYKFRTDKFMTNVRCPVVIFHGTKDEIIYHGSALKLKSLLKPSDKLILLKDQLHNGINDNSVYKDYIKTLLME